MVKRTKIETFRMHFLRRSARHTDAMIQPPEANAQSQSKWIRRKSTEILNNGRDGLQMTQNVPRMRKKKSTKQSPNQM